MKKLGVVLVSATLMLCTGCGTDGGGRPSEDAIADAFKDGIDGLDALADSGVKVSRGTADCMGRALHGSKLSDEALRAMVDPDTKFDPSGADDKALRDAVPAFMACIPGMG